MRENSSVSLTDQRSLSLNDTRAWVCPLCSAVLPGWSLDAGPYEHCDPRPPHIGMMGSATLDDGLTDEDERRIHDGAEVSRTAGGA